ncbi:hypothetical protein MJO29_010888 [Puccinia striiformis f. sp. tritici]|nr:hypothetical protein MJO29_010888 [Puccinia striiformis f. sp. tritici]
MGFTVDKKARASILLSYLSDGNGVRLWDLDKRSVVKSRDILFEDSTFPYGTKLLTPPEPLSVEVSWPAPTPTMVPNTQVPAPMSTLSPINNPSSEANSDDPTIISLPPLTPPPPSPGRSPAPSVPAAPQHPPSPPRRRSGRERRAPDRLGQWSKNATLDADVDTPKTWRQLLKSPNKHRWLKAADEEFSSLLGMNTWKLARLVAMGYSQIQGLDYDEVFSPTLRLETLWLMFSLLASRGWTGRQVDFKTAFLNGHLDSPVFMEQPPGFEDRHHPDWVCEVSRSLYGLKQSPRQWNIELHKALLNLGLSNSKYDPTLYFKLNNNKLVGALTTHVDDLAVVGEPSFVTSIISSLGKRFKIGADEELNHFLSIKISRDLPNRHVFMNQSHYISELCDRFLGGSPTPAATPTDINFKNLGPRLPTDPVSPGPYPQLIGSLLWVSQCTRPDISFAVNRLSQHLRDPSYAHWHAGLRVLNYLVSTKSLKLRLGGELTCSGFSDSDWAED